jgi:hypothetical protein
VTYWEIIADNLSKAGWSWGCVSAIDSSGRTIFVADAHRVDEKRFVVRADEKLTAFLELRIGNPGSRLSFLTRCRDFFQTRRHKTSPKPAEGFPRLVLRLFRTRDLEK